MTVRVLAVLRLVVTMALVAFVCFGVSTWLFGHGYLQRNQYDDLGREPYLQGHLWRAAALANPESRNSFLMPQLVCVEGAIAALVLCLGLYITYIVAGRFPRRFLALAVLAALGLGGAATAAHRVLGVIVAAQPLERHISDYELQLSGPYATQWKQDLDSAYPVIEDEAVQLYGKGTPLGILVPRVAGELGDYLGADGRTHPVLVSFSMAADVEQLQETVKASGPIEDKLRPAVQKVADVVHQISKVGVNLRGVQDLADFPEWDTVSRYVVELDWFSAWQFLGDLPPWCDTVLHGDIAPARMALIAGESGIAIAVLSLLILLATLYQSCAVEKSPLSEHLSRRGPSGGAAGEDAPA